MKEESFEEWFDSPFCDYQVTKCGKVSSLKTGKRRVLSQHNLKGYKRVNLFLNGKAKGFLVHRIVALTFLSKTSGKNEVNHIDGNKSNNNLSNLEWVSHSENMRHAAKNKLMNTPSLRGESATNVKLTQRQVDRIRSLFRKGVRQCDIARKMNIKPVTIWAIVHRKNWN